MMMVLLALTPSSSLAVTAVGTIIVIVVAQIVFIIVAAAVTRMAAAIGTMRMLTDAPGVHRWPVVVWIVGWFAKWM